MKLPKILLPIVLLCAMASCRKVKVQCKSSNQYLFRLYRINSADTIPDTLAAFTPYQKGSNFATEADSTFHSHFIEFSNAKAVVLSHLKADCGNFDWKIVVYPSGRQYLVKNFIFYERSEKQVPDDTQTPCFNDYSFAINDSIYNISPGYSDAYVEIQVRY